MIIVYFVQLSASLVNQLINIQNFACIYEQKNKQKNIIKFNVLKISCTILNVVSFFHAEWIRGRPTIKGGLFPHHLVHIHTTEEGNRLKKEREREEEEVEYKYETKKE